MTYSSIQLLFTVISNKNTERPTAMAEKFQCNEISQKLKALSNCARMQIAQQIHDTDSKTAKWITSDKLQELTSQAIQRRLRD